MIQQKDTGYNQTVFLNPGSYRNWITSENARFFVASGMCQPGFAMNARPSCQCEYRGLPVPNSPIWACSLG